MNEKVCLAVGGRGCAIEVAERRFDDQRFVELLGRYFGVGRDDFSPASFSPLDSRMYVFDGQLCASVDFLDAAALGDVFELVSMCCGWTHVRAVDDSVGREICLELDGGFVRWGFGYCREPGEGAEQPSFFSLGDPLFADDGRIVFSWRTHDCFADVGSWSVRVDGDAWSDGLLAGDSDAWGTIGAGAERWLREFLEKAANLGIMADSRKDVWDECASEAARIDALRDERAGRICDKLD